VTCKICGREDCDLDTMCIRSPSGTKVVFLGENGYDAERARAMEALTVGAEYVIDAVEVEDWSSSVILDAVPGRFNSVMFGRA
jgi:hypothetical protein